MDKKKLLLLVGALIVAIGTAFAARSLFSGASTPQAEAAAKMPLGPKVLVAQRGLPVGTIITADSIGYQNWPKDMVQDAYFVEGEADMAKLLGTVVRNPITAGEPVTQGSLVAPGDRGFLAAALQPGMRAVTIPVSARTGVAGFVFPGDHIDLVLTQTVKVNEGQALKASETILKNLRVLATDQSTEQEMVEGKTRVRTFSTVTLEVTPKIAEEVAVAQTIGTISLSLRSLSDNSSELEQAVASGTVKVPAGASKAEEERLLKAAMTRPLDRGSTFVTGGDVSRFQRKTMPLTELNGAPRQDPAPAAPPMMRGPAMGGAPMAPRGPVVRITRGKTTEAVPVSSR
ncbi:Flp pilus assembly protein CpaB [Novosphingobium sp. KCTC 2891]|uniref:Flp pilus assembly protein CpaB n=1 Tax=Novosphingobium sp. KCTC 2891 TaxID=2989730 RepID=UPI00222183BC|nr:Flp pilus assembly protein CpaB [Novosphingobium sp. KCTC 2891]MCW1381223.1 Flp pilus assembly protein CpaB [Novosphingobium sp. KCTC 2891]